MTYLKHLSGLFYAKEQWFCELPLGDGSPHLIQKKFVCQMLQVVSRNTAFRFFFVWSGSTPHDEVVVAT